MAAAGPDWNSRFSGDEYAYGKAPNSWLEEISKSHVTEGMTITELGAGEGRNAVWLAKAYAAKVTALDMSEEGGKKTQLLAKELGVEVTTITGDACADGEAGSNDVVVASMLHMPPKRDAMWSNISRILKPGGILLGEWYHPKQAIDKYGTGGPPDPTWCIDEDEVKAGLGTGGDYVLLESGEREVVEGAFHTGKGFTTRVVWRKAL
mmetsp:Transcript_29019/g.52859  ORF Transcript_29019/g.52859 Transcript_29019/m.52859 type:complete len:207 (+) Transcript_29019:47-667(+)